MKTAFRGGVLLLLSASLVGIWSSHHSGRVLAAQAPAISMDVGHAGPRPVEDQTQKAIVRDYGNAWVAMTGALDQNRPELLGSNFTGTAREKLMKTIQEQQKSGLRQHIVDRGHQVEAVFYSPEGSAMELRDTARMEIQLFDNNKVVHSGDVTLHYIAIVTAAENSWQVRVLQSVPGF